MTDPRLWSNSTKRIIAGHPNEKIQRESEPCLNAAEWFVERYLWLGAVLLRGSCGWSDRSRFAAGQFDPCKRCGIYLSNDNREVLNGSEWPTVGDGAV